MSTLFRLPPVAPVQAYRTWSLVRPANREFFRDATCEEVNCLRFRNGWRTVLDLTTAQGLRTADWITRSSGRKYTLQQAEQTATFTFERGQRCFEKHKLARERDPIFVVRDGDHRGNPTGRRRVHKYGVDWRDDMQENLSRVAEDRRRG